MNAPERLADALKAGGKIRGARYPVYFPNGTLDQYTQEYVEVDSDDVKEVCLSVKNPGQQVKDLLKGVCHPLVRDNKTGKGKRTTHYADDIFQLLEEAGHPLPAPPAVATPDHPVTP